MAKGLEPLGLATKLQSVEVTVQWFCHLPVISSA